MHSLNYMCIDIYKCPSELGIVSFINDFTLSNVLCFVGKVNKSFKTDAILHSLRNHGSEIQTLTFQSAKYMQNAIRHYTETKTNQGSEISDHYFSVPRNVEREGFFLLNFRSFFVFVFVCNYFCRLPLSFFMGLTLPPPPRPAPPDKTWNPNFFLGGRSKVRVL